MQFYFIYIRKITDPNSRVKVIKTTWNTYVLQQGHDPIGVQFGSRNPKFLGLPYKDS